jgi:LysM repeat protein
MDGKMKYGLLLGLSSMVLLSGCETLQTPQQREQSARQEASTRYTEERVRILQAKVESMEADHGRLMQEVQQLREIIGSYNSQLAQLNSNMQALDARQAREMKNLIATVERMMSKAVRTDPGPSTSNRGPGREHVVEKGHTLSAIAQAYGTTVSAIKKANNLKNDNIYVGQKLFIPE